MKRLGTTICLQKLFVSLILHFALFILILFFLQNFLNLFPIFLFFLFLQALSHLFLLYHLLCFLLYLMSFELLYFLFKLSIVIFNLFYFVLRLYRFGWFWLKYLWSKIGMSSASELKLILPICRT